MTYDRLIFGFCIAVATAVGVVLSGCATSPTASIDTNANAVTGSLAVSAAGISLSPILAKDVMLTASQNASIAVGAPGEYYAPEITANELDARAGQLFADGSINDAVYYMGSRGDHHYFAYFTFLEARKIYRVAKSEYTIEKEFSLTTKRSRWILVENNTWVGNHLDLNLLKIEDISIVRLEEIAGEPSNMNNDLPPNYTKVFGDGDELTFGNPSERRLSMPVLTEADLVLDDPKDASGGITPSPFGSDSDAERDVNVRDKPQEKTPSLFTPAQPL